MLVKWRAPLTNVHHLRSVYHLWQIPNASEFNSYDKTKTKTENERFDNFSNFTESLRSIKSRHDVASAANIHSKWWCWRRVSAISMITKSSFCANGQFPLTFPFGCFWTTHGGRVMKSRRPKRKLFVSISVCVVSHRRLLDRMGWVDGSLSLSLSESTRCEMRRKQNNNSRFNQIPNRFWISSFFRNFSVRYGFWGVAG